MTISVGPTPRPLIPLPPGGGDDAVAIQAVWDAGKDILVGSAPLTLRTSAIRPLGARIIGNGPLSSVLRLIGTFPGNVALWGSNGKDGRGGDPTGNTPDLGGFSDLTVDSTQSAGTCFYRGNCPEPQMGFARLAFVHCQAPDTNSAGCIWSDISLKNSSLSSNSNNATFNRIEWTGMPDDGMNEFLIGGTGVAFNSGVWSATQRGMIIRWSLVNSTFKNLTFRDIVLGPPNAGEQISQEANGPMQGCLFDTVISRGGNGRVLGLDYGGAANCTFQNFDVADGFGVGIGFNPTMGADSTNNLFHAWELRRTMFWRFNASKGNMMDHVTFVNPAPTWGCEVGTLDPSYYAQPQTIINGAAGNSIDPTTVRAAGMMAGWSLQ